MSITFRPTGPDDDDFLLEVYRSTRTDELALVPWDDAQKDAFVRMQSLAQHNHYREHYPTASYEIILSDDRPVGRLYIVRLDERISILDMTILPAERNKGLGTSILKDLMNEAAQAGKPLQIYVENFNPSLRLFERLGFSRSAEEGFYFVMEWSGHTSATV